MPSPMITDEVLASFLQCKYKAWLKSTNKTGVLTDFEQFEKQQVEETRTRYHHRLMKEYDAENIIQHLQLNSETVPKDTCFISPTFVVGDCRISFDAVISSSSTRGRKTSTILPIVVLAKERISHTDRLHLAMKCLLIDKALRPSIPSARLVHGRDLRSKKINLHRYVQKAEPLLDQLNALVKREQPPDIFYNTHCSSCEFQSRCLSDLRQRDDLSLLTGMSTKEILDYRHRGLCTVTQLSHKFRPRKTALEGGTRRRPQWELKALAICDKRTYVQRLPSLPTAQTAVYVDFESLPDEDFVYLIGACIVEDGVERTVSFWADKKDEESSIFDSFLQTTAQFNNLSLFCFGSYEIQTLRKKHGKITPMLQEESTRVQTSLTNILSLFSTDLFPPTYSNGLKHIAQFLGFSWSEANASGSRSILWRKFWEASRAPGWKQRLLTYNIEDCQALKLVTDWARAITASIEGDDPRIVRVADLNSHEYLKWGNTIFETSDLNRINKLAYFSYQRDHIYLRINKDVQAAVTRERKLGTRKLRQCVNKPNKVISLFPDRCPRCGYVENDAIRRSSRTSVDLKFTNSGVRRNVTRYDGGVCCCTSCRHRFTSKAPSAYPFYGDNLAKWCISQYVQYNVSFHQLTKMVGETFNIEISPATMKRFKRRLADKYRNTYIQLQEDLLSSNLLHIDETRSRIRDVSTGYVWVMAGMDTVVYLFRRNRQAGFLKELLKNYDGVLVTDFYSGYDGLACAQQKCLIHLIRDMNNDLVKHQLDTEYRQLVVEFAKLLRVIVETIDKYGLKVRHLNKHKKDVEQFYRRLVTKSGRSEIAAKYKERFRKCKEKLFTFLQRDGIPWNNNNAEHAIKPFARFRRDKEKQVTERGIRDYLVLLSIQQTCYYRGIRFLDFLKSGSEFIT